MKRNRSLRSEHHRKYSFVNQERMWWLSPFLDMDAEIERDINARGGAEDDVLLIAQKDVLAERYVVEES